MYLFLHDDRLLREIQEEFQASYPYLRMAFFWSTDHGNKNVQLPVEQESLLHVSDISKLHTRSMISLEDYSKLEEIERALKAHHGLTIHFLHFTKAGWLPATAIHTATFGELNQQGRESFHDLHNISANPDHLL